MSFSTWAAATGCTVSSRLPAPPEPVHFLHATLSNWLLDTALNGKRSSLAVRLAQDDFHLIDALWHELRQRLPMLQKRASPGETLGQIVLFTESDTTYSQGIAQEMQTMLSTDAQSKEARGGRRRLAIGSRIEASHFHLPSRTRRTAGLPIRAGHCGKCSNLWSARGVAQEARPHRTNSGPSQFDYLRRQAMLLKLDHLKEPVVAVGVLGSDVYDKLIVLQALRPELAQAVFFTTDLDALYLHADNVEVTRNLLVVSANDLLPDIGDGEAGWNVPPMRDSYQTILFEGHSAWCAVEQIEDVWWTNQEAMLFEIGAGTAVLLEQFPRDPPPASIARLADPFWNLFIFALAVSNGILVLWAVSSRKNAPGDERKAAPLPGWARSLLAVEFTFAGLAIVFLASLFLAKPTVLMMEPLSWTLGISIWPTILIRCLAFLVALMLMVKASQTVDVKYRFALRRLQGLLGSGARLRQPCRWNSAAPPCGCWKSASLAFSRKLACSSVGATVGASFTI